MITNDPDAELLPRIAAGDQASVQLMVARKLPRLLALGVRMLNNRAEAEDVAQETFVRLWQQAAHWQSGDAKLDTWLHRVALNLCYDRLRSHAHIADTQLPDDATPEQIDPTLNAEQRLALSQQGQQVSAALALLPTRQREALVLQYYQELTNHEAASLMGVSVEALESLLARARRNLRALLIDKGVTV